MLGIQFTPVQKTDFAQLRSLNLFYEARGSQPRGGVWQVFVAVGVDTYSL